MIELKYLSLRKIKTDWPGKEPQFFCDLQILVPNKLGNFKPCFFYQYRNAWFEGPKSGGESAGPGSSDAGAAHQSAASHPTGQVRPPAVDAAPFAPRRHPQGRAHFLPKNHRQHAHGESALRHVQELIPACV